MVALRPRDGCAKAFGIEAAGPLRGVELPGRADRGVVEQRALEADHRDRVDRDPASGVRITCSQIPA